MDGPTGIGWLDWILNKDNSEVVRNLGVLAAAVIGLPFLIWRTWATNRTATAALRRAEASAQQSEIAADQSIAEAFTRAITHLGDKKLEIRLGGIYALERIARDSKKDHWTIIEILTAFVRENAPWIERPKEGDKPEEKPSPPKPDIQTILTVLGRRERAHEEGQELSLDLRKTDLRRADLEGAYLQGADLNNTHFDGANLKIANLQGADLQEACLQGADLQGADLLGANLQWADLRGADLQQANLQGAVLQEADLQRAYLQRAYLQGANLLGADLLGADLRNVKGLTKEQIESAVIDDKTELPGYLVSPLDQSDESEQDGA